MYREAEAQKQFLSADDLHLFNEGTHFRLYEPRQNYRVGAPGSGHWQELLNSNARDYGGSGQGNFGGMEAAPFTWHGRPYTLTITLPPLGMVVFKQLTTGD